MGQGPVPGVRSAAVVAGVALVVGRARPAWVAGTEPVAQTAAELTLVVRVPV